jgi:alkylated DNA repair dioxygenase AlkB
MHADRLTPLGKRPTIASLSLGATRTFRLKRADPTETAKDAASGSAEAKGLPH